MLPDWFSYKWFLPETFQAFVWGNPYFLYGLLAIPFVFLFRWFLVQNSRQKLKLTISKNWGGSSWYFGFRWIIPIFFGLALFFGIIALARPQLTLSSEEEFTEGLSIVLALDISESMGATDLLPNRLEAAKMVANRFLSARVNDRIGLVVFAGEAYSLCPLTSDYILLRKFLDEIQSNQIKASGTAIGEAIATSINRLRDAPGTSKAIILLSDGDNTAGTIGPETATELAKSFGIRIYSIAIGKNTAEESDFGALKKIALSSRGAFYTAGSGEALSSIFTEIDKLERYHFENEGLRDVSDYYYVYLNWSICFVLLSLFVKNTPLGNVLED